MKLGADYDDLEITDSNLIKNFSTLAKEFILTIQKILDL
jgi:hypothetical protein